MSLAVVYCLVQMIPSFSWLFALWGSGGESVRERETWPVHEDDQLCVCVCVCVCVCEDTQKQNFIHSIVSSLLASAVNNYMLIGYTEVY